jgi:hypothetical protein
VIDNAVKTQDMLVLDNIDRSFRFTASVRLMSAILTAISRAIVKNQLPGNANT